MTACSFPAEAAIRVMEPDAENIWAPMGGEPVIVRLKKGRTDENFYVPPQFEVVGSTALHRLQGLRGAMSQRCSPL